MRKFLTQYRAPLRFTLALLPVAAAAGYLVIRYQLALYDPATLAAMLAQLGSTAVLLAVGTAQTVVYAAVCGFFGYLLAEKLGLMRPFRLEKRPLLRTLAVSLPLGLLFSLDYWTFGVWLPGTAVQTSAAAGLTVWGWLSAILYGGVMEELFMRLFLMSLLAFLGWRLFFRREKQRCFLLNGGFGLVFGRLYRRYGIQYAMLSHAVLHIVSKLIWTIFA